MDNTVERMRALVARDEAGAMRRGRFSRDTDLPWPRALRWPLLAALALLGAAALVPSGGIGATVPAIQAGLAGALAVPDAADAAIGADLATVGAGLATVGAAAAGLVLLLVLPDLFAGLRWALFRR